MGLVHGERAMRSRFVVLCALIWCTWLHLATGFYLPGVAPNDYRQGDRVALDVNHVSPRATGAKNRLRSVIAYDYYYPKFHFCQPADGPKAKSESLGAILFGDRIYNSPVELYFLRNTTCNTLCQAHIPADDARFINGRIRDNYALNWLIDGLPVVRDVGHFSHDELSTPNGPPVLGLELGTAAAAGAKKEAYFNNHYEIRVLYHQVDATRYRIVGLEGVPQSKQSLVDGKVTCDTSNRMVLSESSDSTVAFTYTVVWVPSDITWGTRWDAYLLTYDSQIHWFSIINSMVVIIFLTGMIAMVLVRTLRKDIARYNSMEAQEDLQEDFGWKLVHGDVFRPPAHYRLLSVLVGNGCQLFYMAVITLLFAAMGFLSPSNRGSLATMLLCFYVFFSVAAGYNTSRIYKMFGGSQVKRTIALSALLVPGLIFLMVFCLNFFLIGSHSSGAVPAGTLLAVIDDWFYLILTFLQLYGYSQ
ncbi:Transmembrane 9 super member 2 [Dimargaris verticillata]|uniref:Transmembrane 9 superfamily member n=1 Tax=Dimargaris verticillata TaxID=2761393 RepID=A0A9W8EBY7_9FUNG|nr:Transmembrane 9 super member 2 [Dimargaris verticillata]